MHGSSVSGAPILSLGPQVSSCPSHTTKLAGPSFIPMQSTPFIPHLDPCLLNPVTNLNLLYCTCGMVFITTNLCSVSAIL